ncbi:acetyltransferase [Rhodococcus sp. P27]|nr:acetyltransferase [Rhodococcus sp. P27]
MIRELVTFSAGYLSDAGGYGRIVNQDLIIRRYLPSDEDVVVDLWSRAAREAHPFLTGEGTGEREQKMREVYLIQADNWVAEHNSEVVGLLGMIGSEIGGLFVAPASQGLGVGRALVEHATTMHGEVTLEVYTLNDRARRFYALMEFEEEGRRHDAETNHELITLRRTGRDSSLIQA